VRIVKPKEFLKSAVYHLENRCRIKKTELEELNASVTHWMQSPYASIPMFSKTMRVECEGIAIELASGIISQSSVPYGQGSVYPAKFDFAFDDIPYPPPSIWDFTFIDLFAGIGGFRQAFQNAGGKCLFSSEWDRFAKKTYEANYGEVPYGDITRINKSEIPDHDVLCAGFPCQPFSLAGVSKKNSLGRKHGFEDETQGTLFFEIKEILRVKRPKAFMLENVKNLLNHDKGKTFEVIRHALQDQLGYVVNWKIVDGGRWVPQHRERIFIVGYDPQQIPVSRDEIIIPELPEAKFHTRELRDIIKKHVDGYTVGPGTWNTLKRHKAHHAKMGNGFGYRMHSLPIKKGEVTRTISARYHKDGAEILIEQPNNRPRRLTIEEAMQLQGYDPSKFIFPVSKTQAYRQIGNSVVVPAISTCASEVAEVLRKARQ
jgi:DNA (cytosine-5)-methyltransferase 1